MKTVQLNGKLAAGRVAVIDDEDFDLVSQFKWHVTFTKSSGPYAASCSKINGAWKTFSMHKLITDWPLTDHEDGDGLNNQRSNLRPATNGQNGANMKVKAAKSSQYKGVSWRRDRNKWQAAIKIDRRQRNLGFFTDELEAARAYDRAARDAWGPYARVNAHA
jgi:hypothetical protein